MSERPARALVIGAHPDDSDFGAGGTLAGWAARGTEATLLVLTDGSRGSHDPALPAAKLRDRREAEQRNAAAILGLIEVRFLRAVDGELASAPPLALALAVAAAVRELRPEVVLTHDPWARYDLHPDHAVAGRIVVEALYLAREPRCAQELATRGLRPWRPLELWLWGAFEPDHREPIDETCGVKLRALLCHRSQYVTSFGIDPGHPDERGFAQRVRDRSGSSRDGGPTESFRRLPLPGWPGQSS